MNKPVVSIITINYNNLEGLKATHQSVIAQDAQRTDYEWLIIDGGSTDDSKKFIESNNEHIDHWVSEPDEGIYDAMNKGITTAKGDYLWFLNSGDRFHHEQSLQDVLSAIEQNPNADVFFGDTDFVDEKYQSIGLISELKPQKFPEKITKSSFRFGMNICHQSIIVRTAISPNYNLEFKQASDIDWILNVLELNPITHNVPGVLSDFQIGGSSTENSRKAIKERYEIFKNHFGFLPNILAHVWIVIRRVLFNLKGRSGAA